jgi:hypothetical protein
MCILLFIELHCKLGTTVQVFGTLDWIYEVCYLLYIQVTPLLPFSYAVCEICVWTLDIS